MISDWFTDDELISQLRMQFDYKERDKIDYRSLLGQIIMVDDNTGEIRVKGRVFRFDMKFCGVYEGE